MLSKPFYVGAAGALAVAIITGSFVIAQDNAQQPAASEVPHYRAKQILGAKVGLQGNTSVGTVDDIVLDESGNVDYLIVLNANKKLVTVPWDATQINVEKRTAIVEIPQERFQQAPTYTVDQYPAFSNHAYRTQVYTYYGLKPGQARRAFKRGTVIVP
jgi:hypothetical protein